MCSTKSFLILAAILLLAHMGNSQVVLTDWELARQSGDINISYRDVEVGDTLKTREMCLSFFVESSPDRIIPMFKEADKLTHWSAGTKKCKILRENSRTWLTYSKYDFPWPFKQEDLVTEYEMEKTDSLITLFYKSGNPEKLPYYQGVSVSEKYKGHWSFATLGNGKTKVEFHSIALFKSSIPKFIQDPIVQDILIESINNLKTLLATEESQLQKIIAFE